jgi:pimeloyl-ACP methyl ester carboxylesterase
MKIKITTLMKWKWLIGFFYFILFIQLSTAAKIQLSSSDSVYYNDEMGANYGSQLKWDITSIPADTTITQAEFCSPIYIKQGSPDNDVTVWYINDEVWTEESGLNLLADMTPLTETTETMSSTTLNEITCFDVTTQFQQSIDNSNSNFTFRFADPDNPVGPIIGHFDSSGLPLGSASDRFYLNDQENSGGSSLPVINVTYTNCTDSDSDGYGISNGADCSNSGFDCDDSNVAIYPGSSHDCGSCNGGTGTISYLTSVCRASAGTCDTAETCTGSSLDCPADAKSSAECRASAGTCDIADDCDGVNNDCPADAKSSAECRAASDICDIAESCDGSNNDCPADVYESAATTCRASTGTCDITETCTGSSAVCPIDGYAAEGLSCGVCQTCNDAGSCIQTIFTETSCFDGIDNDCDGNVDNYDNDCTNETKTTPEEDQSKIVNNWVQTIYFNFLMYVERYNTIQQTWQFVETVVNDTDTGTTRQVNPGGVIGLDTIWNPLGWDSSGSTQGTYRAIVSLTDSDGNVLGNSSGSNLTAYYNFTISASTSCGNNIKESGEDCDGTDFGGASCTSKGYDGGSLSCTSACAIDTKDCYYIGSSPPPTSYSPINPNPMKPTIPPVEMITITKSEMLSPGKIDYFSLSSAIMPWRVQTNNWNCRNNTIESLPLADEKIPRGYEIILEPFSIMRCKGASVELKFNIPETYTDVKIMRCNPSCSTEKLKLTGSIAELGEISSDVRRAYDNLSIEWIDYYTKEAKATIDTDRILSNGNHSVEFYGKDRFTAKIIRSKESIPEPKNAFLMSVSVPLIINVSKVFNIDVELSIPYNKIPNIDEESLKMYGMLDDNWELIGGDIIEGKVVAKVDNIDRFFDSDNKAIFSVIGVICEFCHNSSLTKVYDGNSKEAIILVHGLASSPSTFDEVIEDIRLTEQPYQTWTLGYSSQRTIEEISKEFMELLELKSQNLDKIHIAAHSMGGLITQKTLYDAHLKGYKFVDKVDKVILVGVPNEGSAFLEAYGKLFKTLINKASRYKQVFDINGKIIKELKDGMITPQVPEIDYYVIAGTNPYELGIISGLKDLNVTHDGLVSVPSAQNIGGEYIDDRCSNFWDLPVTHTQLIDDDNSRKVIERIIAKEIINDTEFDIAIGYTNNFELLIESVDNEEKFILIGKKISKDEIFDENLCLCGNGVCGEGETILNCPKDCLEMLAPRNNLWLYAIILIMIILIVYYIKKRKKRPIENLDKYIETQLNKGISSDLIKKALIKKGWKDVIIEEEIYATRSYNPLYKLVRYIEQEVKKGIDLEPIRKKLEEIGWKQDTIEKAFKIYSFFNSKDK